MVEGPPPPQPTDPGVDPVQSHVDPATFQAPTDLTSGLAQGQFAAAIREAGAAFRAVAPQVVMARWAEDYHRRLDEREAEIRALREELTSVKVEHAQLEERLRSLTGKNRAEDVLKIMGGAAVGAGVQELIGGRYFVGGICVLVGLVLAYLGGAVLKVREG
jgi:hypothetical protein